MKNIIIIIVVILLAYGIYRGVQWGKKAYTNFDWTPSFGGIDLTSLLNGSGTTTVDINIAITNNNNFQLPISDMNISIYYKGQLLASSTVPQPPGDTSSFTIPKNGSIVVPHNITVQLGPVSSQVISDKLAGGPLTFTYNLKAIISVVPRY